MAVPAMLSGVAFTLPDDLAATCFDRLGVPAPVDVGGAAALVEALGRAMPTGTTTKLHAVATDQVPPGAQPAEVAQAWLDRPEWAWSCWAMATLFAALVGAGGTLRADVLGARRVGPMTPPVDIHSVVEVHDGGRRWLTDPYFWAGPVPDPGGDHLRPGGWCEAFVAGPTWWTSVGSCSGRSVARYRTFTAALTPGDVEALCRISVTHTGVSARPRAQVTTADGSVAATVDPDGVVRLRRWRVPPGQVWGTGPEVQVLERWDEAEQAIATLATGGSNRQIEIH